jgi:hypothetical protein
MTFLLNWTQSHTLREERVRMPPILWGYKLCSLGAEKTSLGMDSFLLVLECHS